MKKLLLFVLAPMMIAGGVVAGIRGDLPFPWCFPCCPTPCLCAPDCCPGDTGTCGGYQLRVGHTYFHVPSGIAKHIPPFGLGHHNATLAACTATKK